MGLKENVIIGRLIPARISMPGMDKLLEPEPRPELELATGDWLTVPVTPEGENAEAGPGDNPLGIFGEQAPKDNGDFNIFDSEEDIDNDNFEEDDAQEKVEGTGTIATAPAGETQISTNGVAHNDDDVGSGADFGGFPAEGPADEPEK